MPHLDDRSPAREQRVRIRSQGDVGLGEGSGEKVVRGAAKARVRIAEDGEKTRAQPTEGARRSLAESLDRERALRELLLGSRRDLDEAFVNGLPASFGSELNRGQTHALGLVVDVLERRVDPFVRSGDQEIPDRGKT